MTDWVSQPFFTISPRWTPGANPKSASRELKRATAAKQGKIRGAKAKVVSELKSMTQPGFFQGTGMPDPGWWEALWPDPAGVLAKLGITPGMTVIDLCSGDGWFTLQIARIAHTVYAIDIDRKLLTMARIRLNEANLGNCQFIEGDAFDIAQLAPERADYVFLANAFHGVPDPPRLTRAVHDSLKACGLFVVVNWHARRREETTVFGEPRGPSTDLRMTPEATFAAIEPSGFKTIKLVDVSPYHYGTVFQRL